MVIARAGTRSGRMCDEMGSGLASWSVFGVLGG